MTDKQMQHIMDLAKRRKKSPRNLKQSDKAVSDGQRHKADVESARAAKLWLRGMDREVRKP